MDPLGVSFFTRGDHFTKLETQQERWQRLLTWLREVHGMQIDAEGLKVEWEELHGHGRGLAARVDIPKGCSLFSVPTSALLNARTLLSSFPEGALPRQGNPCPSALTAIQAVSLFLAAHRRDTSCPSAPYIDVLPHDFGDHPLQVIFPRSTDRAATSATSSERLTALGLAPPSFQEVLSEVVQRCEKDLIAVEAFLSRHPNLFGLQGMIGLDDYLWGWLNVNTRQVWTDLGLSKRDNVTLAPIFDMCNHTCDAGGELKASLSGQALSLRVPYDLKRGDEVLIQYGNHSNAALLAEYGFVLDSAQTKIWQVRVSDLVLDMLKSHGDQTEELLSSLNQHGYEIRDFALHFHPEPASPSYGLIVALRLLFTEPGPKDLAAWFQVLWGGDFAHVYPQVDAQVVEALYTMCSTIVLRAERGLDQLRDPRRAEADDIRALWQEELTVALAVEANLRKGLVDFD